MAREVCDDLLWLDRFGVQPKLWRTPWGDLAPWSGVVAAEVGLELWGWSDDTHDWAGRTAPEMLDELSSGIGDGSVILMHDGVGPGATRTDAAETIELIAPLVELCRSRGLHPGPISLPDPRPALA